ncbi:hypothetical protein PGB90_005302 [Kerria lacca]
MSVEQNKSQTDDNLFSWIRINRSYFLTLPGILKIINLILGVICLSLASPAVHNTTQWFLYVTIICVIVTVIWCFIYFLSVREAINFPINWHLTEMFNMSFLALIIVIASIFQISHWAGAHNTEGRWKNIIAGIFGIGNCVLYLISTCSSYVDWRQTHSLNP